MAKLLDIWRCDHPVNLMRRQMPLIVDEKLTMIMDLNQLGFINESPLIRGKPLDDFIKKFNMLTKEEIKTSFKVTHQDILTIASEAVPCVGCRKSVERLFYDLMGSSHQALDPLIVTTDGMLTIKEEVLESSKLLCTMLQGHSARLSNLLERQPRNKKSRRCALHSMEVQRMKLSPNAWKEIWGIMKAPCRREITFVAANTLESTLDIYLRKHRFCGECRTKVLLASTLLTTEPKPTAEKGYVPALYAGIKRCIAERHVHLPTNTEYISSLISRAQTEVIGRERHAKTLDIAQEEVLTCLGICITDRLHRIHRRLKEEETVCRVFAAVAIDALSRNFQKAVEAKQGISQLELLYEEFTREEYNKQQRREKLRLKRKKKKERKYENTEEKENSCMYTEDKETDNNDGYDCIETVPNTQNNDRHKLQCLHQTNKDESNCKCLDCLKKLNIPENISTKIKLKKQSQQSTSVLFRNKKLNTKSSQSMTNKDNSKNKIKNKSKKMIENDCNLKEVNVLNNETNSATPYLCCNELFNESDKHKPDTWYLDYEAKSLSHTKMAIREEFNNDCELKLFESDILELNEPSSQDYGYLSEHNVSSSSISSTPEGSEIACSEGYCSHEAECPDNRLLENRDCAMLGITLLKERGLTLTQMLEDSHLSEDEGANCYISAEEVQMFKAQMCQLREKRLQLRQNLRERFALLCSHNKPYGIL